MSTTWMPGKISARDYYIVFGVALLFRLGLFFCCTWENEIIDDYDRIAVNIVEGHGFSFDGLQPTVCRPPAYPAYLACQLVLFGHDPFPYTFLRLTDILLSSITSLLVVRLASSWLPGRKSGAIGAGLLYAVNPFAAYYAIKIGAETMSIFFLVLFMILLHRTFLEERKSYGDILLLGLTGGVLLLSKSLFLPLIALGYALLFILYRQVPMKSRLGRPLAALFISLAVLSPWTVRNFSVSGQFVPIQTLSGFNFWLDFSVNNHRMQRIASGNLQGVDTTSMIMMSDGTLYAPYAMAPGVDAAYDRRLLHEASAWALANPGKLALKVLDNFIAFWYEVGTVKNMVVCGLFSILLLCIAYWGCKVHPHEHVQAKLLFVFVIVGIDLLYAPGLAVFRYSVLTYPYLSVLGGAAVGPFLAMKHTPGISD